MTTKREKPAAPPKRTVPITVGPRICGDCGKDSPFMITMQPGWDGVVWFLCFRDFLDGCKPQRVGNFKIDEVSVEMADALRAGDKAHMEVPERQRKAGY